MTATPSMALVVATSEDTRIPPTVEQIPAGDPGFAHVGSRGSASAVYVGYGWMLTAAHVAAGDTIIEGTTYGYIPTTDTTIDNADLRLYRLSEIPDLPALTIASSSNSVGDEVVMIGRCAESEEAGWNKVFDEWVEVTPPSSAQHQGYKFTSTQRDIRWGTNQVYQSSKSVQTGSKTTTAFTTIFNEGREYEAQVHYGDSGGAVFHNNGGEWELNGIMIAMDTTPTDYPPSAMLYGRISFSAKLSVYRNQIIDAITPLNGDANLDGIVDVSDLGILSSNYGISGESGDYMWDVGDFNGDATIDASDLGVLASSWGNTADWYNPPMVSAVPEPSVLMMALFGSIALACRRRRWISR